jgi:hypothetical protein
MNNKFAFFRKPVIAFVIVFLIMNSIFWLFQVKEFEGTYRHLQNGVECMEEHPANLSLSYFIGIGTPNPDVVITKMTLTLKSIALAFCICLFTPLLIAYRVHLGNNRRKISKSNL